MAPVPWGHVATVEGTVNTCTLLAHHFRPPVLYWCVGQGVGGCKTAREGAVHNQAELQQQHARQTKFHFSGNALRPLHDTVID